MQIHDLTQQTPTTNSQLIFDTGSATYKALVSDIAKCIIEQYAGSTLGGTAQTLAAAIGQMYNIAKTQNVLTSDTDLNTLTTPGHYSATIAVAGSCTNCPITRAFRLTVETIYTGTSNTNYLRQTLIQSENGNTYVRTTASGGNTWTDWRKMPTRDEMNIVTGYDTIKTLTASDDLATLDDGHYRLNSAVPLNAPSALASSSKYGYVTIQHRGASAYTYYEYVAGNGNGTSIERHFGWKSTAAGTTIAWEA